MELVGFFGLCPAWGSLTMFPRVRKEKQEGKMTQKQIGFWMLPFFPPGILHFRNTFLVTQGVAMIVIIMHRSIVITVYLSNVSI